jgi:prepilin-type N-terminal cleavage/methylation domain-containing protein
MSFSRPASAGFTLLELLLVIAVIGILVAVVLPNTQTTAYDQLRATAHIVATDLAYARSLAVANNSSYKVACNLSANRFVMTHSGTNTALNTLPKSPFSSAADPSDQHIVDLDELPHMGYTVRLAAVASVGTTTQTVSDVEFGPLGQTTRTDSTVIWLMAGGSGERRYITVAVNPVTGMSAVGEYSTTAPPSSVTQIQ